MMARNQPELPAARRVLDDSFTEAFSSLFTDTVFNFIENREALLRIRPILRRYLRQAAPRRRPRMRSAPPAVLGVGQPCTPMFGARQAATIN